MFENESESTIAQSTAKRAVTALSIIAAALVVGVSAGVYLYLARHSVPSCGSEDATQLVQRILSDSLAKQLPSSKGEVIGRAIKFSFDMIEKGELSPDGNVRKCSARLNVTVADEMLRKPLDAPVDARWRQLYDEESKKLLAPIKYELRALDDKESSFLAEVAASDALAALTLVLTEIVTRYEPGSRPSRDMAVSTQQKGDVQPQAELSTAASQQTAMPVSASVDAIAITEDSIAHLRFGTLSVAGDSYEHRLVLGDRIIYETDAASSLSFHSGFQLGSRDVVLVMSITGGTACYAQFFLVTVTAVDQWTVTPEFGTCSDIVTVSHDSRGMIFRMPNYREGMDEYVLAGDVVTQNGVPVE